jgi:hypothetical protein
MPLSIPKPNVDWNDLGLQHLLQDDDYLTVNTLQSGVSAWIAEVRKSSAAKISKLRGIPPVSGKIL